MRALPTSRSLLHFWEQAVFLEAALLADPETKHLAPPVTETLDDFSALLQKELTARRVLVQAYAHGSVADANLDTGIRSVFSSTLHLTGQDRKRTEFTSLFGSSIAAIVRHALRKQLEVTKDLLRRLSTLSVFPDSFKNDAAATLSPLVAAGDAAVEEPKAVVPPSPSNRRSPKSSTALGLPRVHRCLSHALLTHNWTSTRCCPWPSCSRVAPGSSLRASAATHRCVFRSRSHHPSAQIRS